MDKSSLVSSILKNTKYVIFDRSTFMKVMRESEQSRLDTDATDKTFDLNNTYQYVETQKSTKLPSKLANRKKIINFRSPFQLTEDIGELELGRFSRAFRMFNKEQQPRRIISYRSEGSYKLTVGNKTAEVTVRQPILVLGEEEIALDFDFFINSYKINKERTVFALAHSLLWNDKVTVDWEKVHNLLSFNNYSDDIFSEIFLFVDQTCHSVSIRFSFKKRSLLGDQD